MTVRYPPGTLALQDVISAYGQPSHILAGASPSVDGNDTVYGLDIVYLKQGFALGFNSNNNVEPDLGPSWSDFHLYFFEPTLKGFGLGYGNPRVAEYLVPWRGLLSFDDYCVGSRCK